MKPLFTPTTLYYDSPRRVTPGHFLRSSGGSVYLIERVRSSPTRRQRKYLDVLRYDPAQVPVDAVVHPLFWYKRRRRRA
jgi:hypothetical protein